MHRASVYLACFRAALPSSGDAAASGGMFRGCEMDSKLPLRCRFPLPPAVVPHSYGAVRESARHCWLGSPPSG